MIIQRCIFTILVIIFVGCQKNKKSILPLPEMAELIFVDSLEIQEENQFFSKPSNVNLIGDSLIAISSYLTPGIWFIELNSGKIKYRIVDGEIVDTPIFPSAFDTSEFPFVYVLNSRLQKIQKFNAVKGELVDNITLTFPNGKIIRTIKSLFIKRDNFFQVELYPEGQNNSLPEQYKPKNKIIGIFDKNGKYIDSYLIYPKELAELDESIMAYQSFVTTDLSEEFLIVFPSSGEIKKIDLENRSDKTIYKIPKKSRFFDFQLKVLKDPYDPNFDRALDFPTSHFFSKIVKSERNIYLQSDLRDNSQLGKYSSLTNIFWIDQIKNTLYETKTFDPSELGLLVGADSDTLYFFEGSLKKTEKKYIKRAVLRPIED